MIRYSLTCDHDHCFESWFQDSAAFDKQAKRGLVRCPACGSATVEKAIMAPHLAATKKRRKSPVDAPETTAADKMPMAMLSPQEREFRKKLKDLRDHLVKNADHVGPKFPEQARKMHYGEIEHRSIYGEASPEEAQSLVDEGVEFHPLPILPDDKN
jgi:hypothetical protein